MKRELRDAWVAALRSGEYQQTTEVLRDIDGHCAIGVLCEVQGVMDDYASVSMYVTEWASFLSAHHAKAWGLRSRVTFGIPKLNEYGEETVENLVTYLNDDLGLSFEDIADVLESLDIGGGINDHSHA